MKTMNKIFTVGAMGVALTSMEAKADLFKCTACPAGYRCDGSNKYRCDAGTFASAGASSCSPCGAGTYSNAGAGSCSSCGDNAIVNSTKTGCISITDPNAWSLVYNYSSGEGSATLSAGTYLVSLHGGNGGGSLLGSGGLGGSVTYKFTVNSSWTFKYGVGENGGTSTTRPYPCGGGGGGSWIAINNQYIVAGGGGGANGPDSDRYFSCNFGSPNYVCKGGHGGDVGGGDSERIEHSYYEVRSAGGSSGNYKGGGIGRYINGYYVDKSTGYNCKNFVIDSCYNASTESDEDEYGEECIGDKLSSYTFYPGYGRTSVGGGTGQAGSATHVSNINISSLACGTSAGCVKLYKLK